MSRAVTATLASAVVAGLAISAAVVWRMGEDHLPDSVLHPDVPTSSASPNQPPVTRPTPHPAATGPTEGPASPDLSPSWALVGVTVEPHAGFDRIAFAFTDGTPAYEVKYVSSEGLDSSTFLLVTFNPDVTQERPDRRDAAGAPVGRTDVGLPFLKAYFTGADGVGRVIYVLGLNGPVPVPFRMVAGKNLLYLNIGGA
ncbi:MAG TPA: hypothetical protein VMT30_04605 [Candidatus Saccharimonadia bacterium]|nr:hypothetical protein [Candidatus Saccharimonadia bacterium]